MARNRKEEGGDLSSEGDSSSASLEEISEQDFKRQESRVSRSGAWMGDLMRYHQPVSRNFAPDLYSFAWAQAVQNKPLGFVKEEEDDCEMVVDDEESEKEDGELEEGEIDFGVNLTTDEVEVRKESSDDVVVVDVVNDDEEEEEVVEVKEIGDFDKRVGEILEELETITAEEAETSFEGVCSRLQKSFASFKEMFTESHVPALDVLVQQAFMGIETVYDVVCSGNLKKKEQNQDLLLRLLIHIKNQYSSFLTSEQIKEIDVTVHSLASQGVNVEKTAVHTDSGGDANVSSNFFSSEKPNLETRTNSVKAGLRKLELPTNSRSRGEFSPLLDLHAAYDEGSLPSPTRVNTLPLPLPKPIGYGGAPVAATQPVTPKNMETDNGVSHPYVTDAFKLVSSYYGRNSMLANNRLPSPTPSEDCKDDEDDSRGEVSSSSVVSSFTTTSTTVSPSLPVRSSGIGASTESWNAPQLAAVKMAGQPGLEPNPVIKAPARSRDPRLRMMKSEVGVATDLKRSSMAVEQNIPKSGLTGGLVNSKKQKTVDEPLTNDYAFKRQKNGPVNFVDVQAEQGRGGWIEDSSVVTSHARNWIGSNDKVPTGIRKLDATTNFSGSNGGFELKPSTSTASAILLPAILKDLAVNPTMLMQLIQDQQRLAVEAQQKPDGPANNALSGAVSSANGAFTKLSEVAQTQVHKSQIAPQTTSTNPHNDMGRIRMKPRDPRRILHTNMVQKSESLGSEPTKTSGTLQSDHLNNKDRLVVREQAEQSQTTGWRPQSTPPPDITQQFTKNLKNVADIISCSQSTSAFSTGPTQNSTQSIPSQINKDLNEPKCTSGLASQGPTTGSALQPANPWGDVDHLFDGYDDQQKADIQKERTRRIAEQNKMFASRKLCLVLDLDHTLLNSAKFIEVDPVHEEILRKKEEQDREKAQRHLFRFQHMGMWTKLRPGVWNFLEKASKLYELHLYTMGNKLYATEMAKVLDPTGALFAGRVISKGDDGDICDGDERVPKIKDLDGVLGMESAVVIIDDSVRVWPHNKLNLIVVERYTYFPCSRRQFGLLGPSLLEIDHDERPEAGTLASSLAVIEKIHENFFSHEALNEVDVRNILASEQRKILGGCKIVFSRVFPVGEANPNLHPLWQTAEQFGAVCTNQIDEQVTHVVANSLGTDKVNWALSTGRFVVHPGWVEASALLYRRANEQDFSVKP